MRVLCSLLAFSLAAVVRVQAAEAFPTEALPPLSVDAPAWKELTEAFRQRPDARCSFVERRFFSFRRTPLELKGEARVSAERGLSLHYTAPEERVVLLDSTGVLVRDSSGEQGAPADARAAAAQEVLLRVLRFDFAALTESFELFGRRGGAEWFVSLVPRTDTLRRSVGEIRVSGAGAMVRQIDLIRGPKQRIEIALAPPVVGAFTTQEVQRYFR